MSKQARVAGVIPIFFFSLPKVLTVRNLHAMAKMISDLSHDIDEQLDKLDRQLDDHLEKMAITQNMNSINGINGISAGIEPSITTTESVCAEEPPDGPDVSEDLRKATESLAKLAALRSKVWQCGFPPLPIVVNNGNGDTTVTSSFSLLMTIFQNQPPGFYSGVDKSTFCKNQIYPAIQMHSELKELGRLHEDTDHYLETYVRSNTELLYDVVVKCFRTYVSNMLQMSHMDLRFKSCTDVTDQDQVAQEMKQWLRESCGYEAVHQNYTALLCKFFQVAISQHDEIMTCLEACVASF